MTLVIKTRLVLAVGFAVAHGGAVLAQLEGPAELPPSGFEAVEYVDSTGCVFSRVDVGDRVEWVPRVDANRQPLCGFAPSIATVEDPIEETLEVAEPAPQPSEPVIEPLATPTPAPPPTPMPVRTPMRTTTAHAPPPVVHPIAPRTNLVPAQIILPDTVSSASVSLRAPCADPNSIAAQYLENSIVPPCTTAAAPPADVVYGTDHPRPPPSDSAVARLRIERPGPPAGYAPAWTDGRLNPYRGIRTVEGDAQMRMVWTNTVPRRLVPAN